MKVVLRSLSNSGKPDDLSFRLKTQEREQCATRSVNKISICLAKTRELYLVVLEEFKAGIGSTRKVRIVTK